MHRLTITVPCILLLITSANGGEKPSLESLRKDYAQRYVEPEPHMALARYHRDHGNPLQALRILELARHRLFPQEQFDKAFERKFSNREPFDNSTKAESDLLKQHVENPAAREVIIKLADIYVSRADWPRAKECFGKALKLDPEDFSAVESLAEVLRRERNTKKAERVIQDYIDKYPESKAAYGQKIQPLMKKDPAAAKALLVEAMKKYPQDGGFVFNMGVLLQEKDLKGAEEHYVKAAALDKGVAHIQGWTGRFFLKVKKDEDKALEYYFKAYFLDPHFYDSEYAESRIRTISNGIAQRTYTGMVKSGTTLEKIVQESNPIVVTMALGAIGERWDRKYITVAVTALGHDDEAVRVEALQLLQANVDRSFDNDLKGLLADKDLRKRGMAGYLAVKLWGEEGIRAVTPWLNEDAQLLRYDAISSLFMHGDEQGRKIVRDYRPKEKHPWFQEWLKAVDKQQ